MRVLFVTTRSFIPQSVGGAEWSTHYLCAGLQQHFGDEVAVLCDLDPVGRLMWQNRVKKFISRFDFPADRYPGYRVYRGWNARQGLPQVVAKFSPDVMVVVGVAPGAVDLGARALATGLPVVYTVRDVEFDRHGGDLRDLGGARFVSNSVFTASRLREQLGIESAVVLPPILSDKCRVPLRGEKVLVINPDPVKGGEIALALAAARPSVPFIFQESWAKNRHMTDLKARTMNLPNVQWREPVSDIRSAYKDARLLLAASQCEEAWGRVASEAHVSGIPVLGSRIGGLEEAIGPGGALLPPDAPVEDWLAALDRLWMDEDHWAACSRAALAYAKRPELDPARQISTFREVLALAKTQADERSGPPITS